MTLSEEDFTELRSLLGDFTCRFLSTFLHCDDVTWNSSTRQLLLAGEVLTNYRIRDPEPFMVVTKKFWRKGNVHTIGAGGYESIIDSNNAALIWFAYGHKTFKSVKHSIYDDKKRHIAKSCFISGMDSSHIYDHRVMYIY